MNKTAKVFGVISTMGILAGLVAGCGTTAPSSPQKTAVVQTSNSTSTSSSSNATNDTNTANSTATSNNATTGNSTASNSTGTKTTTASTKPSTVTVSTKSETTKSTPSTTSTKTNTSTSSTTTKSGTTSSTSTGTKSGSTSSGSTTTNTGSTGSTNTTSSTPPAPAPVSLGLTISQYVTNWNKIVSGNNIPTSFSVTSQANPYTFSSLGTVSMSYGLASDSNIDVVVVTGSSATQTDLNNVVNTFNLAVGVVDPSMSSTDRHSLINTLDTQAASAGSATTSKDGITFKAQQTGSTIEYTISK